MDLVTEVSEAPAESAADQTLSISSRSWGKTRRGSDLLLFTLKNKSMTVQLTNLGARIVAIMVPDRAGKVADVVLGYASTAEYQADTATYMGATVGRYANRIAEGRFALDGTTYQIPQNDGPHALHGGTLGFDQAVWTTRPLPDGIAMELMSADGDMGFPGELTTQVRYTLDGSQLRLDYSAQSTKPTVVNLTNHVYFNLAGEASGSIADQQLRIAAEQFVPVDAQGIPTGKLLPVAHTPFDFRTAHAIGQRIDANGFDHTFVLHQNERGSLRTAAEVFDPRSGRTLHVRTTEPGVHFYSGNFLDGSTTGKSGIAYTRRSGFCLETQHFPNSPNEASFPSTVLRPGETLHSTTVFAFGVRS